MIDVKGTCISVGDKVSFVTVHHRMNDDLKAAKGKSGYVIKINEGQKEKALIDFDEYKPDSQTSLFTEWWINPKNLLIEQFNVI